MRNPSRFAGPIVALAIVGLLPAAEAAPESPGTDMAWMGVMLGRAPRAADEATSPEGVPLMYVVEGGPAADAGLRARDRVVTVNGVPVSSSGDLLEQLRRESPGNWVQLTVERGEEELDLRIRLGERPTDMRGLRKRRGWIGVSAIDLPPELREHFGATSDAGVMISGIETGSPAEAAGIRLGDVVYEIDGAPVGSLNHLHQMIGGGGVGNELEIVLARAGVEIVVEAVLDAAPEKPAGR